jgi:hypothetical protein
VWPFVPLELRWYGYVLNNYFYRYPDEFADVLKSAILILAVPAYATVGAIVASYGFRLYTSKHERETKFSELGVQAS